MRKNKDILAMLKLLAMTNEKDDKPKDIETAFSSIRKELNIPKQNFVRSVERGLSDSENGRLFTTTQLKALLKKNRPKK